MIDLGGRGDDGGIVLLRHGRSVWNRDDRFAGWVDVPLDEEGVRESLEAGRHLKSSGLLPDVVHSSLLTRARDTVRLSLGAAGRTDCRVVSTWRLNERHYGALQGLRRSDVLTEHGAVQFRRWRRAFDERPPPLRSGSEAQWHPYAQVTVPGQEVPSCESLHDVEDRLRPYVEGPLLDDREARRMVLIVAHGNTLRVLLKMLLGLPPAEALTFEIPTGTPIRVTSDLEQKFHVHSAGQAHG